jgi:hypothetical protein
VRHSGKKEREDGYDEGILDDSLFDDTNKHFVRRIQVAEVEKALRRMEGGEALGPDGIPLRCGDVWVLEQ